jgi:hypothetical protein
LAETERTVRAASMEGIEYMLKERQAPNNCQCIVNSDGEWIK